MHHPSIVIVTPALADANNGNWQTAKRWAALLKPHARVRLVAAWAPAAAGGSDDDAMIALHARRSAASIAAWKAQHPQRPLLLALTGTDLYRDIHGDASAQHSLTLADAFVVLNELGMRQLPAALQARCHVVLQSCAARQMVPHKPRRHLRALMVGHLRDEKSPRTYFEAARLLAGRSDILLDHLGNALDAALGAEAQALMQTHPHYRWLGGVPHAQSRRRIALAHVLVHPSRMEGGAHVVMEAARSGTPVLASRIDGNVGLLGADYGGYFEPGDAMALAALLQRARDDTAMLPALQGQVLQRAPLFAPEREAASLWRILSPWLAPAQGR